MLRRIGRGRLRPAPEPRKPVWMPVGRLALSAGAAAPGERLSSHRRALQRQRLARSAASCRSSGDWDGCVAMGREQVRRRLARARPLHRLRRPRRDRRDDRGGHAACAASVNAPLVIDSTETPVLEAALKLYGGKPIINSINFEDGEEAADRAADAGEAVRRRGDRADHRRNRHGEDGRATSCAIARRLVDFACNRHGLPQSDLLIDPLTFTICTGNEDDRKLGVSGRWRPSRRSAQEFPEMPDHPRAVEHLSFGLNPAARAGAELGVPRPRAARGHDRRDRACLEDRPLHLIAAGGGAGRRGPDLRPPRARATIRCSAFWRCSPTARPANADEEGARRDGRGAG